MNPIHHLLHQRQCKTSTDQSSCSAFGETRGYTTISWNQGKPVKRNKAQNGIVAADKLKISLSSVSSLLSEPILRKFLYFHQAFISWCFNKIPHQKVRLIRSAIFFSESTWKTRKRARLFDKEQVSWTRYKNCLTNCKDFTGIDTQGVKA